MATRRSKTNGQPVAAAVPPPPEGRQPTEQECREWVAELRKLHGGANSEKLDEGGVLKRIKIDIGRHFEEFVDKHLEPKTGLNLSRTQAYRLIAAHETWDGSKFLDRFDLSALYSLSPRWPNRGEPTEQQKAKAKQVEEARKACLERAKKGEFITNKIALKALEKSGAKSSRKATVRRPSITAAKKAWNAAAKKRKLDPEKVMAMLTDLNINVTLTDAAEPADEAA